MEVDRIAQRNKTRNRTFRDLIVEKYGLNCTFCHVDLIDADRLPRCFWVKMRNDGTLVWKRQNGEIQITHCLTLEHLLPIGKGGLTTVENVVPCCAPCNCERNMSNQPRKQHFCVVCGRKRRRSQSLCDECAVKKGVILKQLHDSWLLRVLSQGIEDERVSTDCQIA